MKKRNERDNYGEKVKERYAERRFFNVIDGYIN